MGFPFPALSLFLNLHLTLNKANPKQINCRLVLLRLLSLFQVWLGAGRQEMPAGPAEVHVAQLGGTPRRPEEQRALALLPCGLRHGLPAQSHVMAARAPAQPAHRRGGRVRLQPHQAFTFYNINQGRSAAARCRCKWVPRWNPHPIPWGGGGERRREAAPGWAPGLGVPHSLLCVDSNGSWSSGPWEGREKLQCAGLVGRFWPESCFLWLGGTFYKH